MSDRGELQQEEIEVKRRNQQSKLRKVSSEAAGKARDGGVPDAK